MVTFQEFGLSSMDEPALESACSTFMLDEKGLKPRVRARASFQRPRSDRVARSWTMTIVRLDNTGYSH